MKKIVSLSLALLMLLCLCGCGAAAKPAGSASSAPQAAPAAGGYYGGFAMNDSAEYAAVTEDAYYETPAEPRPEAESGGAGGSELPSIDPEKIIYSAAVNVETTDFDETIRRLEAMVAEYGGFIESSSRSGNNYYVQARGGSSSRSADYCLRVPSGRFQELMGELSTLGNIPWSHTYTENISAQYYDVQARLNACRTQEARLLEMMELAETVEDLITIEDRLASLRYQIESLQTTLNGWDRQVSYSSVNVSVQEVAIYTPEAAMSYGQQLKLALTSGLNAVGRFFKNLLIGLTELLPTLLILVPLVWLCVFVIKKLIARGKRKQAARWAAQAAARQAQTQQMQQKKDEK